MVRAPFEVSGKRGSFRVMVRAPSISRAEEVLKSRHPDCEVCLIFPIDGEEFFAAGGDGEEIEDVLVLQ